MANMQKNTFDRKGMNNLQQDFSQPYYNFSKEVWLFP